jgi:PAS domain S-box-containing protein
MDGGIRVPHVDDEPGFADTAASLIEREDDRLTVETATSAAEGMKRIADGEVDCVVSDYDMPRTDGLEFLDAVREERPDLPFVLFTGKGSEAVASDAISGGATDYLQKESGTDQYEVLANRIRNVVEQHRDAEGRATLERIRATVNEIDQALVRASSRDGIERRACTVPADAEPYRFAVIVSVTDGRKRIEPRAWAGEGEAFLEEFEMRVAEGTPGREAPGGRAFHEREVATVQDVQADPTYERWRDLALDHGFRSLAVAPLAHGTETYGLLAVLSDRRYAFDDTETEVLAELADDVAHAIHARAVGADLRDNERRPDRHREYTERVIDVIDDPFFVVDGTGALVRWNETFEEVTGCAPEEIESTDVTDFVPVAHRDWIAAAIDRVFETGRARLEAPLLTKDGDGLPYEYAADRVEHPDGEPRLVGIGRDVAERRARERTLERRNEQLDGLERAISADLGATLATARRHVRSVTGSGDGGHVVDALDALESAGEIRQDLIDELRSGECGRDAPGDG